MIWNPSSQPKLSSLFHFQNSIIHNHQFGFRSGDPTSGHAASLSILGGSPESYKKYIRSISLNIYYKSLTISGIPMLCSPKFLSLASKTTFFPGLLTTPRMQSVQSSQWYPSSSSPSNDRRAQNQHLGPVLLLWCINDLSETLESSPSTLPCRLMIPHSATLQPIPTIDWKQAATLLSADLARTDPGLTCRTFNSILAVTF